MYPLRESHLVQKYPEKVRTNMGHKILPGILFFKQNEYIFINETPEKITSFASFLLVYGVRKRLNLLRQIFTNFRIYFHLYDYQDHEYR